MEQRLIDANALETTYINGWGEAYSEFTIDNAPTLNAVPVVRCGECNHLEHYHDGMSLEISGYLCGLTGKDVKPTDFCSCFEPRENFDLLGQYEDTGLTPAEVAELAKAKPEAQAELNRMEATPHD